MQGGLEDGAEGPLRSLVSASTPARRGILPGSMSDYRDPIHGEATKSIAVGGTERLQGRVIVVWEGGAVSRDLPEAGELVIGRALDCDVTAEHASVSRQHAKLHVEPGRLLVEDLGSANGTRVRGRKLGRFERVEVMSGETVELGGTQLVATSAADTSRRTANVGVAPVVGHAMRALYSSLEPIASSDLSILLLGETGVGKDVVAAAIHGASRRSTGPFLAINCAALPEALLESELFGHERGAFSGAQTSKSGLLEAATGGTVLLDELGELTVPMQSKLLRAIENREIFRVGSVKGRPIDVRFLGATSRDLEALVRTGAFRPDLLYRVSGAVVRVPPLRERPDEIEPLAVRFVSSLLEPTGRPVPRVGAAALGVLQRHAWPGNVRELRNVVERAALVCKGPEITPEHIALPFTSPVPSANAWEQAPPSTQAPPSALAPSAAPVPPASTALRSEVEALERRRILEALEQCGGNQTRAAKALGISRRTLLSRLDEYGVPRPRK